MNGIVKIVREIKLKSIQQLICFRYYCHGLILLSLFNLKSLFFVSDLNQYVVNCCPNIVPLMSKSDIELQSGVLVGSFCVID